MIIVSWQRLRIASSAHPTVCRTSAMHVKHVCFVGAKRGPLQYSHDGFDQQENVVLEISHTVRRRDIALLKHLQIPEFLLWDDPEQDVL
jgi:hypothetical protein